MSVTSAAILGCGDSRSVRDLDVAAARALSDSVMLGLVRDRVDLILDKLDPEIIAAVGQPGTEAAVRKLFDYCGRPLDLQFDHDELRNTLSTAYGRRVMRRFKYTPTTTTSPKGVCIWSVDVVRTDEGLRVAYLRAGKKVTTNP